MSDKVKENISLNELIKNIATLEYIYNENLLTDPNQSELFINAMDGIDQKTTEILADEFKKQYENLNTSNNSLAKVSFFQLTDEARDNYKFKSRTFEDFEDPLASSKDYELIFTESYSDKDSIPSDRDILFLGSERTIKPANYYGHTLSSMDIAVICDGNSNINARFFDGIGLTKFSVEIDETMKKKVMLDLDVNKEAKILKDICDFEKDTGKKILTDKYNDRNNYIEDNFSKAFKSAQLRAENPVTYKNVKDLNFLYPGDVVFLGGSLNGIDIEQMQSISKSPNTLYYGNNIKGEEVFFNFDQISVVHQNDTEFNRNVGELNKSKDSTNIEKSEGKNNNKAPKTKDGWRTAIENAKQKKNNTHEIENRKNRNDKTR